MLNMIPAALWLVLIALNIFMFMFNFALGYYEGVALNALSGAACYLAYYTTQKYGEDNNDGS